MPPERDRPLSDRSNRAPARPGRRARRPLLGWEALEPRFLLAGPNLVVGPPGVASVAGLSSYEFTAAPPGVAPSPAPGLSAWRIRAVTAGPPSDRYVIVPEAEAPHDSLASAQRLPDLPSLGIEGTLGPDDSIEFFRVPMDAGTQGLQFGLRVGPSGSGRLWLIDEAGHVLGEWSSARDGGVVSVSIDLAGRPPGSAVFLGIGAAGPDAPVAPMAYQLWVSRQTSADRRADAEGGAVLSATIPLGPFFAVAVNVRANPPGAANPSASHREGRSRPAPTQPGPMATGPMPTRSAGPLGGALTDGERTPRISGLVAARADLDPPDLPPPGPAEDPPVASGALEGAGRTGAGAVLVTLQGPGGFPLLAAALAGDWAGDADPSSFPIFDGGDARMAGALPDRGRIEAEEDPPAEDGSSRARSREARRASLRTGPYLAAAFSFSVLLFDPATIYQSIASLRRPASPGSEGDPGRGARPRRGRCGAGSTVVRRRGAG